MKTTANIIGGLLGFLFIALSLSFLLHLMHTPPPPQGSPAALFMGALYPTGYLTFVQVCELIGGLLVVVPRTRNFGLLILGPIVVNILAYHIFIMHGEGLAGPPIVVGVLAAFLLWVKRGAFAGLARK